MKNVSGSQAKVFEHHLMGHGLRVIMHFVSRPKQKYIIEDI